MMNELNTIVQFLSAIYLTITIDSLMFKRFWTPNLYGIVSEELKKYDFALSSPVRQQLLSVIKGYGNEVDEKSRRRGSYFLALCITMLFVFSIETSLSLKEWSYLVLLLASIVGGVTYILGVFLWKRWRHVIYSFIIMSVH